MALFTSSREKQLWFWVALVILGIFLSLFIGRPLLELFSNQDIQAVFFLLGMALTGIIILVHGLKRKTRRTELILLLGIITVYLMLFLRLGLPERSHLIEYSILAIFIHNALHERFRENKGIYKPLLLSFVIAFLIGVMDELIQIFLPDRVFDLTDILFNGIVITVALTFNLILTLVSQRYK